MRDPCWHAVRPIKVNTLDGDGNKHLFPFKVGLNLFFPTVLEMTALVCPKLVWFQVCQLVLSQGWLCYRIISQRVFLYGTFPFWPTKKWLDELYVRHGASSSPGRWGGGVLLGVWGSAERLPQTRGM